MLFWRLGIATCHPSSTFAQIVLPSSPIAIACFGPPHCAQHILHSAHQWTSRSPPRRCHIPSKQPRAQRSAYPGRAFGHTFPLSFLPISLLRRWSENLVIACLRDTGRRVRPPGATVGVLRFRGTMSDRSVIAGLREPSRDSQESNRRALLCATSAPHLSRPVRRKSPTGIRRADSTPRCGTPVGLALRCSFAVLSFRCLQHLAVSSRLR